MKGPVGGHDVIRLEGLVVECVIGVYPGEREIPQPLEVDVALELDTRKAAGSSLKHTVDYARLCGELRFLLEKSRFLLLETAAEALCRYLLAPPPDGVERARVDAATVKLTKPAALAPVRASLEIHRRRGEYDYDVEEKPFGTVDVIYATKGCGIYRLRIAPGSSIPTHVHQVMDEHEMVLGDGLLLQREPVLPGTVLAWPHGLPHRYDNPTDVEQTVLCIDRPSFLPDDEVEVPDPPEGLARVEGERYYPADEVAG